MAGARAGGPFDISPTRREYLWTLSRAAHCKPMSCYSPGNNNMTDILDLMLAIRLSERVGRIGYVTHAEFSRGCRASGSRTGVKMETLTSVNFRVCVSGSRLRDRMAIYCS